MPNNTTVSTSTSIQFRRAGQQGPTKTLTAALKDLNPYLNVIQIAYSGYSFFRYSVRRIRFKPVTITVDFYGALCFRVVCLLVRACMHTCVNSIGCQYADEWSSRLHVWHTNRLRQQHRRTHLPTFNSSLSMVVVISAHLPTEHSLFHAHIPLSRRQKFCCRRTTCVEQFAGCYKTDHQLRTV